VRLVERRGVDPAERVVLAEHDPALVVEVVVVRGKTRVNRRELLRPRVVHFDLPRARAGQRKILREPVRRSVLAERRLLLRRSNPRRHPHAPAAVHRHAAGIGRPLPNLLVAPERRRRRVGVDRRRVRRNPDLGGCVLVRIEHGNDVGALDRSVDESVRVHRRRAVVGRGDIGPAAGGQRPVPQGDDDVAFDAGRTRRRRRIRAGRDAIGPVGVRLPLRAHPLEVGGHARPVRSDRHVVIPCVEARRIRAEVLRHLARRRVAHLMARVARLGFEQHVLVGHVAYGNLHETEPVIGRIDLRGCACVGRDDGFEIEPLSRPRRDPRRIHQPVPAHEHLVAGSRQIRHDVATLIVGDDDPGELRRQVAGLRDHPHAGFGTFRARDDAADVVGVDCDRGAGPLLRAGQRERGRQRRRRDQRPE